MKFIPTLLSGAMLVTAAAGCTARDEQLAKDLENMPGVTCTFDNGQRHCGPDSLKDTASPGR
ncbi:MULTISPECIES: hypothetical protein [unclassified Bordetella]|uniref:hypothetical protein n=1 Tax=unclassified Bordetella TaxID=2630031 RepID=UPI001323C7A7|nr:MULTISPECIES: hypothetical protein [unclassified Bordetella]MVW70841.1 hypothetical protein [Bordetella sp. 15P40C-2]MVW79563.1 hypothetical protein [Bordetella sp. 02P26C-1]